MKKTITVFGSSLPIDGDDEYKCAYELGCLLARSGFNVCTGGYRGIMEAVSRGVVENGGEAIGVTLSYLKYPVNKYLTREIKEDKLFNRIERLIETGDAYIILQGGTGTLLELAAVWEFMNKNLMEIKPIVCHSSMWKEIGIIIDKQIEREKRIAGLVKYFPGIAGIVEYIKESVKN